MTTTRPARTPRPGRRTGARSRVRSAVAGSAWAILLVAGCAPTSSPTIGSTLGPYPGWTPTPAVPTVTLQEVDATYRPLLTTLMPVASRTMSLTWHDVSARTTAMGTAGCGHVVTVRGDSGARDKGASVFDPFLAGGASDALRAAGFATTATHHLGATVLLSSVNGDNAYFTMSVGATSTDMSVEVYVRDTAC